MLIYGRIFTEVFTCDIKCEYMLSHILFYMYNHSKSDISRVNASHVMKCDVKQKLHVFFTK